MGFIVQNMLLFSISNWNKGLKSVYIQEMSRRIICTVWYLTVILVLVGDKSQIILLNIYIFTFPDYAWCQIIPISVKERDDCLIHINSSRYISVWELKNRFLILCLKMEKCGLHTLFLVFFYCRLIIIHISVSLIQFVKLQLLLNEEMLSELFMFGMFCKDTCFLTQTQPFIKEIGLA